MFALRRFIVMNRLWLAVVLLALGFYLGFQVTWWLGWLPMLIAVLMVVAHFMVGPVTIMQRFIEEGDVEGAQKIIRSIKYPNLLYKPFRSMYYMLKANFSAMGDDLDAAEAEYRKGLESGTTDKEFQGTAYLQLGTISLKKGNMKEAYQQLREAIKIGLPDADSTAMANLYLCQISASRGDYRSSKNYYAKAKAAKSKNAQIVEQINELKKQMARLPG